MTVLPDSSQQSGRAFPVSWPTVAAVAAVAVVAAAGVLAFQALQSQGSPLAGHSAAQIAQMTSADMRAAGSLRSAETDVMPGHPNSVETTFAGTSVGIQTVTAATARITARVIGATTYVQASTAGWEGLGLTSQYASALGSRDTWIALHAGDVDYTPITEGDTVPSIVQETTFTGPVTLLAQTVRDGQKVVGLRGTITEDGETAAVTEWVTVNKHPLPVSFTSRSATDSSTITFSDWGAPITVTAPAGSVSPDALVAQQGRPSA